MTNPHHSAAHLLQHIDSPLAENFLMEVDGEPYPNWDAITERFVQLSGGEQAIVQLAQHLTGRGEPVPVMECFGLVDDTVRIEFIEQLTILASQLAR